MDRPVVGKYRRGFLSVSVAAFVFWVALIYVFNRNVVVDDEIDIRSLIITGKDLIHPNAVERSEETVLRLSDSKDAGVDEEIRQSPRDAAHGDVLNKEPDGGAGTEEEVQQPLRNTADKKGSNEEMVDVVGGTRGAVQQPLMIVADRKDSNEEPMDGVGTKGAVQQPLRNAADRKDSNEELLNSMQIKDEVQQPARNVASRVDPDEEMVDSMQTKDREAQQPLRNITEGYGSKRVKNSTKIDEESQQPLRNVTDEVGDGSDEELLNTELADDRARDPVEEEIIAETDSCEGRYIFIQILPRRFHADLLRKCKSLSAWTDMCETLSNAGLGPELPRTEKVLSKTGWFSTNQFSLEVIFHNRMKQYKCLTNDSSIASAIYIPYYAGLDVAQYLWHSTEYRDIGPHELVRWLRARPEWKRMFGRDHFLVAGRISWDFRRETFNDSDWGTNLLVLPEVKQMTSLVLESTLIPDATDFAIPYPTYFHPSSDADVIHWQNRMRQLKRPFLFSFAGARRPNLLNSIRDEIIDQCRATKSKCKLLECYSRGNTCYRPVNLIRLFQESIFCLQPQGDSYTRRSTFDSILTGCIPVFFHSGSAYDQYKWHLPSDHTKYSVFIPEGQVKKGKVNIERVLSSIPKSKVEEMQQEVLELIPKIVYADPRSMLETFEDAFDLAVKGVLKRMNTIRRGT